MQDARPTVLKRRHGRDDPARVRASTLAGLLFLVSFALPSVGSACHCDSVDPAIEAMVRQKKWDEAEERAAAAVAKSDSPQSHLCHAHVVLARAATHTVGLHLDALNLPPDYQGTIQLDDPKKVDELVSDEVSLDPDGAAAAIEELESVARRWPTDPGAHRCLLEVRRTLHDFPGFMAALRRATAALAPRGNAAVDELLPYARAYWEENDVPHARLAFAALVQGFPGSEKAQSGYGAVLITQGQLEQARAHFARALAIAPKDAIVLHNTAAAAILARDFGQARHCYERLTEVEPDVTAHYFELATLSLASGPAAATPVWKRYLARNAQVPDDAGIASWAKSAVGVLERDATPHDLDNLAAALNQAQMGISAIPVLVGLTQRDPEDPLHHFLLAQAYEQNHLPQVALAELQTAESLQRANTAYEWPQPSELDYELGRVALMVDRIDLAVEHLARETGARPEHGDGQYVLGLAYLRQGRRDLAHAAFERCLEAKQASGYVGWCLKNATDTAPAPPPADADRTP
jgi:tetratricopeptide (TPR) repeat protein